MARDIENLMKAIYMKARRTLSRILILNLLLRSSAPATPAALDRLVAAGDGYGGDYRPPLVGGDGTAAIDPSSSPSSPSKRCRYSRGFKGGQEGEDTK
ncbi:hypothetical protein CBR_g6726 [Chara braunii]|uniref:Uncharacterized protein n=1 Tax=Chara braunii TaxID=69332 RepID=A0A388KKM3_CHABU|nr:hypothetical protein CBR_g6726 [Chara braunii]|eukprot:GBG70600.1 hypothetical protein CBR_g6726 [Chara braunii]